MYVNDYWNGLDRSKKSYGKTRGVKKVPKACVQVVVNTFKAGVKAPTDNFISKHLRRGAASSKQSMYLLVPK